MSITREMHVTSYRYSPCSPPVNMLQTPLNRAQCYSKGAWLLLEPKPLESPSEGASNPAGRNEVGRPTQKRMRPAAGGPMG